MEKIWGNDKNNNKVGIHETIQNILRVLLKEINNIKRELK